MANGSSPDGIIEFDGKRKTENDQSNAIDSDCAIISDPKTCGAMLQQSTTVLYSTNLTYFLLGTQEILQKGRL